MLPGRITAGDVDALADGVGGDGARGGRRHGRRQPDTYARAAGRRRHGRSGTVGPRKFLTRGGGRPATAVRERRARCGRRGSRLAASAPSRGPRDSPDDEDAGRLRGALSPARAPGPARRRSWAARRDGAGLHGPERRAGRRRPPGRRGGRHRRRASTPHGCRSIRRAGLVHARGMRPGRRRARTRATITSCSSPSRPREAAGGAAPSGWPAGCPSRASASSPPNRTSS